MTSKAYKVVATVEHDCYDAGDIITRHETWADADRACTGHNSLYVRDVGLVCKVECVTNEA